MILTDEGAFGVPFLRWLLRLDDDKVFVADELVVGEQSKIIATGRVKLDS